MMHPDGRLRHRRLEAGGVGFPLKWSIDTSTTTHILSTRLEYRKKWLSLVGTNGDGSWNSAYIWRKGLPTNNGLLNSSFLGST